MSDFNNVKTSGVGAQPEDPGTITEEWIVDEMVEIRPETVHKRPGTRMVVAGYKGGMPLVRIPPIGGEHGHFLMLDRLEQIEFRFYRPAKNIVFSHVEAISDAGTASLDFYNGATKESSKSLQQGGNQVKYEGDSPITHIVLTAGPQASTPQVLVYAIHWKD